MFWYKKIHKTSEREKKIIFFFKVYLQTVHCLYLLLMVVSFIDTITEGGWKVYGLIRRYVQIGGWVGGSESIRTLFEFRNPYGKMDAPLYESVFDRYSSSNSMPCS